MALVSIVIPLYNRADLIGETLASIAAQSHQQHEVILVDDGSTDDSAQVARQTMAQLGLTGQVIEITNSGPDHARDAALPYIKGDLVALLDSDDLWLPDYLSQAVQAYEQWGQEDFVYFTDFYLWQQKDQSLTPKSQLLRHFNALEKQPIEGNLYQVTGDMFTYLLKEQPVFIGAVAFSHATLKKLGAFCKVIPKRGLSVEWEYFLRAAEQFTWLYRDALAVKIRKHDDNISGNWAKQMAGEVEVLEAVLANYSLSPAHQTAIKEQIRQRSFKAGYGYLTNLDGSAARGQLSKRLKLGWHTKAAIYWGISLAPKGVLKRLWG